MMKRVINNNWLFLTLLEREKALTTSVTCGVTNCWELVQFREEIGLSVIQVKSLTRYFQAQLWSAISKIIRRKRKPTVVVEFLNNIKVVLPEKMPEMLQSFLVEPTDENLVTLKHLIANNPYQMLGL